MLGGIRNWAKPNYYVKVNAYGGATSLDMVDLAEVALRRDPDALIIHSGTNDFEHDVQTKKELGRVIAKARCKNPHIQISISEMCQREDKAHLQTKIK